MLQAVCDARQAELLRYYLEAWQGLFTPGSMQGAVQLFGMEYLALGLVVSLFLVLGLSALGPVMIFGNMMLYGLGSGLLMVQLCAAGGWKTVLLALLWTGLPAAAASGCLCFFGACALQVSSRIHAYSFRKHPGGQARPGNPQNMQKNPHYQHPVKEIILYFAEKIEKLRAAGVKDLIIDPGFGFGKTLEHNYEILNKLEEFSIFQLPILIGVSRKSMIHKLLGGGPENALNGTTAVHAIALMKGANLLRVHDVKAAVETVRIFNVLQNQ